MYRFGPSVEGIHSQPLGGSLILRPEWDKAPLEELDGMNVLVADYRVMGSREARTMIHRVEQTWLLESSLESLFEIVTALCQRNVVAQGERSLSAPFYHPTSAWMETGQPEGLRDEGHRCCTNRTIVQHWARLESTQWSRGYNRQDF